jgi:membrane protein YdbS with pleckstrin-like domain
MPKLFLDADPSWLCDSPEYQKAFQRAVANSALAFVFAVVMAIVASVCYWVSAPKSATTAATVATAVGVVFWVSISAHAGCDKGWRDTARRYPVDKL